MSDWHFLVPNVKVAAVAFVGWWAAILGVSTKYSNTITFGSILTAAAVIVLGGLFTLRNNLKTFWKERAIELEEKVKVLEEHAEEKLQERAAFAEQQREIRHQLKTNLAGAQAQLEVERAKHDLSEVTSRIDAMEALLLSRTSLFEGMADHVQQQSDLLGQILDELRRPESSREDSSTPS